MLQGDIGSNKSLLLLALASLATPIWAIYPDVDSMLQAARPSVCAQGSQICQLITDLDNLQSMPQQRIDALQTLAPVADGSLTAASDATMQQVLSVISQRLLPVIVKDDSSGFSAGDEPKTSKTVKEDQKDKIDQNDKKENKDSKEQSKPEDVSDIKDLEETETLDETTKTDAETAAKISNEIPMRGAWIHVLGAETRQNLLDEVPGYRAEVLGVVIGRDAFISPQLTVGLAVGYQHASVKSYGFSGSFMGNKRFQGTLYAGYHFICPFYLNGALTVAGNYYDNKRIIAVPPQPTPFDQVAQSDFSGWEFNTYLESGYIWCAGHFQAIPKVMLGYSHFNTAGYFESNGFDLGLRVKYHKMNFLPGGTGIKLQYVNEFELTDVVPEIHAYIFYDFVNDKQFATASMLGGGFDFYSQGATPAATHYELGASMAVHSYNHTGIFIQYDYVVKEDYHRHQGFIKVRHEW